MESQLSVAVVFPGQGSQQAGAGLPWVDHPAWAAVGAAGEATGVDLAHLLVDAPAEDLRRTREAQLSVLAASLVAWDAVAPTPHGRRRRVRRPLARADHRADRRRCRRA